MREAPRERQLELIRAHPGPGRARRDRGHADPGLAPRAGLGRARPPDPGGVRRVHGDERRLPRALRLPVRDLRARAHEGDDPGRRARARDPRAATRRCAWRWRRSPRSRGCGWRTWREDLLRQAARAAAPRDRPRRRPPRPARLRGRRRGAGRELRRRLHRGRQPRGRRHRHDEELHPQGVAGLRRRHARGPDRPPRPRLPRHLPGHAGGPHERPRAALRPPQRQAVLALGRRPRRRHGRARGRPRGRPAQRARRASCC